MDLAVCFRETPGDERTCSSARDRVLSPSSPVGDRGRLGEAIRHHVGQLPTDAAHQDVPTDRCGEEASCQVAQRQPKRLFRKRRAKYRGRRTAETSHETEKERQRACPRVPGKLGPGTLAPGTGTQQPLILSRKVRSGEQSGRRASEQLLRWSVSDSGGCDPILAITSWGPNQRHGTAIGARLFFFLWPSEPFSKPVTACFPAGSP